MLRLQASESGLRVDEDTEMKVKKDLEE